MALRSIFYSGNNIQLCQRFVVVNNFSKSVRYIKRNRNVGSKTIEKETPFSNYKVSNVPMSYSKLWKPFGFTVAFSSSCLAGAAIWQYENMRAYAAKMMKQPSSWFPQAVPTYKMGSLRRKVNDWWNHLNQAEKLFVPICATNILVFLAWKVPKFQPFMLKYFCSNPASKIVCWPMVLSTFSHYSGIHILANMFVLHSFCAGAVHKLGTEQFLGLYLSAGVISSFTSYIHKIAYSLPGLSLGASGAIMAVLGYVCTQFPDTRLGIIFFPFFTFPADAAIKCIVGFDALGLLLGWKIFDHAAHLGGAACGIAWSYWGNKYIWQNRDMLLSRWNNIRGSPSE